MARSPSTSLEDFRNAPHSGYHWNHLDPNYFEGWYFRLTLPNLGQTIALMYSIQDPWGNLPNSGGAVQILGIDETYLCRTFPDVQQFFAECDRLSFGHWGKTDLVIPAQLLSPNQFDCHVVEGYQATATLNQGKLYDPVRDECCRWEYHIEPIYGWGLPQQATAGWLSYLPIFEPGWQITLAHGRATGWLEWRGKTYQFEGAPAYSEKNWGNSFPSKWFWLNCNSFVGASDLAMTAGGGVRKVLWWQEEVALIGIHYQGRFYEFAPWNSEVCWRIEPWGSWQLSGKSREFRVNLTGTSDSLGTYVRTPTAEGLAFNCRDTTCGKLNFKLWDSSDRLIVDATSHLAGLEVGGSPWDSVWQRG